MKTRKTPELRKLQRWFASVTTRPGDIVGEASDLARIRRLERRVTRGPALSAEARMQIYRDGYFARLIECVGDDYPALRYALGEPGFDSLARGYIAQHPSRSFSLNAYGQGMAAYCRERAEPWAAFAADLARLEWALVEVVHEAESDGLTLETLARIPAETLQRSRLLPSRALRVLAFDHPVNRFFQAFRDELEPELPEPMPTATVVYRRGLALWRMQLEPRAALLLAELVSGVSLEVAVAALAAREPNASAQAELAARLPEWFGSWIANGFFVAIEAATTV